MQIKQLVNRRAVTASVVIGVSAALALAYGAGYGAGNQVTYLLEPLRHAHPALYGRDWLVASTTQYHPVFAWVAAPLYAIDPRGVVAFGIAQLVVMTTTFTVLYRLLADFANQTRLPMFLLLVGLLALGGGRAMAGSYLFAGYLQPSSLATLGWLAALAAWLRDRRLFAGVWLALGGAFHVNFLVLGIGLFAALELSSRRIDLCRLRRLASVLGPSLVVLAPFVPALLAGAHAHDPETALRVLVKFHTPGHYDPARIRAWVPPLVAWLAVAWSALPLARSTRPEIVDRLWRIAVVATGLCVAATAIVSIPPWLGVTRLYVWRIAPFAQLASQLIAIVAALAPATAVAITNPRWRLLAVLVGAGVLLVEAGQLGGGHVLYICALGGVAAVMLAARCLRRPALAIALAVATCGLALASQRQALVDPPLFAPECQGADCELIRWIHDETRVDAVFLVPPYMNWFRLLAERAIVADTKSSPLYPDELVAWYRRLCAMVDAADMATHEAVEARWDGITAEQLLAAARRFDADYVVLDKRRSSARLEAPMAFETPELAIYRLLR